ncbi:MAG TPA: hypothetical protein VD978_11710 [Azospirillum sp.]|nr:hypothetical protein [Azospirillum sp.]
MSKAPHIIDMIDPAMSDDQRQVEFTLVLSDGSQVRTAVLPEHLSGISSTFLNYALVAHNRLRQLGLAGEPEVRTDTAPTEATGLAFGQTPDGKGALILMFGAAQLAVPVEPGSLRSLAMQTLALADALDGKAPLKQ